MGRGLCENIFALTNAVIFSKQMLLGTLEKIGRIENLARGYEGPGPHFPDFGEHR